MFLQSVHSEHLSNTFCVHQTSRISAHFSVPTSPVLSKVLQGKIKLNFLEHSECVLFPTVKNFFLFGLQFFKYEDFQILYISNNFKLVSSSVIRFFVRIVTVGSIWLETVNWLQHCFSIFIILSSQNSLFYVVSSCHLI